MHGSDYKRYLHTQLIETESRIDVTGGTGGGVGELVFNGYKSSVGDEEHDLGIKR